MDMNGTRMLRDAYISYHMFQDAQGIYIMWYIMYHVDSSGRSHVTCN